MSKVWDSWICLRLRLLCWLLPGRCRVMVPFPTWGDFVDLADHKQYRDVPICQVGTDDAVEHLLINGQGPVIGFDHPQDQIQFWQQPLVQLGVFLIPTDAFPTPGTSIKAMPFPFLYARVYSCG
jgi:hypothetical protein